MNLEELTFKQVCNCLGLIKKLVVENIINFDIDTGIATLNYDNATKYLENQNLEQHKEIERLNNIINIKKCDYDYLEMQYSKMTKKDVLEALTYKCEELERLHKCYDEKDSELIKKDNIINELEKWLKVHLDEEFYWFKMYDKLQELKGDSSNE